MKFEAHLNDLKSVVDSHIQTYLGEMESNSKESGSKDLYQAMGYSLGTGGHRIRPVLCLLVADALSKPRSLVLDFACAVELVHNYSLIHDDLPCMDDSATRRGQASNHKVFGEAIAVLAGDALSSEAFHLLARKYKSNPALALELIEDLATASGPRGMVGGQALDFGVRNRTLSYDQIQDLHQRKTGELFRVSVSGSAKICGALAEQVLVLDEFARSLGVAFQIADDIVDGEQISDEPSFVRVMGVEGARKACEEFTRKACGAAERLGPRAAGLKSLASHIYERIASL